MPYQLPVGGRIPYVTSVAGGLGEEPYSGGSLTTDPWGVRILDKLGTPFAQATASRIAYGSSPPYGGYGSSAFFGTPYNDYSVSAYGGFDPRSLLLLGGGALLLVMLMGRK